MDASADRTYLRTQQYRDPGNLTARIRLHERFSSNRYGWHRWVFDQFDLPAQARILEVGCGPGHLWSENGGRLPARWELVLSDFSPGMVEEARRTVHSDARRFAFVVADAEAIPFPDSAFDAVVANFMLHHVPDREKALAEFRRILRSKGRVFAATHGQGHMRELDDLLRPFHPDPLRRGFVSQACNLENGPRQMARWFPALTVVRYDDALWVTEAAPLIAYVLSGRGRTWLVGDMLKRFGEQIDATIARQGGIRITKDAGMIIGGRADGP